MDSCYVKSCRAFVVTDTGQIRDRYGIAPAVTQTNKQTNKHQIKAVWTLASARRYWSNVFCIATGIKAVWTLVRYGTGQIRDSARRDTNTQTNKHQIKAVWTLASARRYWSNVFCIATGIKAVWTLASARRYWSNVFCIATGIKIDKYGGKDTPAIMPGVSLPPYLSTINTAAVVSSTSLHLQSSNQQPSNLEGSDAESSKGCATKVCTSYVSRQQRMSNGTG